MLHTTNHANLFIYLITPPPNPAEPTPINEAEVLHVWQYAYCEGTPPLNRQCWLLDNKTYLLCEIVFLQQGFLCPVLLQPQFYSYFLASTAWARPIRWPEEWWTSMTSFWSSCGCEQQTQWASCSSSGQRCAIAEWFHGNHCTSWTKLGVLACQQLSPWAPKGKKNIHYDAKYSEPPSNSTQKYAYFCDEFRKVTKGDI